MIRLLLLIVFHSFVETNAQEKLLKTQKKRSLNLG